MKKRSLMILLVATCLGLAGTSIPAQTIMPFGDSVTSRGSDPESSYRYWLWQYLQQAGFTSVSFIGTHSGVSDGSPAHSDFDQSYEGGDGWTTDTAVGQMAGIASESPDIVLLDLGANDVFDANWTPDHTIQNLETIIDDFRAVNPGVVILLAAPTPWVPDNGDPAQDKQEKKRMSQLKAVVSQVARDEQQTGANIIKVNLFGGFSARNDTKDGTHPNVQGEQKIAKKFFSALKKVL